MYMAKDKTNYGNRAKGRINGSRKIINPGQEEVPLRKNLSTNVNQPCFQMRDIIFKNPRVM